MTKKYYGYTIGIKKEEILQEAVIKKPDDKQLLKESVETDSKSVVKSIIILAKVHRDRTSQGELAFVLQDLVQQKEIKKSELTKLASLLDFINDMSQSAVSGKPEKRGK